MSKNTSIGGTARPPKSSGFEGKVEGSMPSSVKTPPPPKAPKK